VAVVGQVGGSAAVVDVFGVERFAALVDKRATTPSPAIGSAQQQEARPDRSGGDVLHVFGAVGIAALRAKAPEQHRRRDGFDGAVEAERARARLPAIQAALMATKPSRAFQATVKTPSRRARASSCSPVAMSVTERCDGCSPVGLVGVGRVSRCRRTRGSRGSRCRRGIRGIRR
jgi:hypothetical protein